MEGTRGLPFHRSNQASEDLPVDNPETGSARKQKPWKRNTGLMKYPRESEVYSLRVCARPMPDDKCNVDRTPYLPFYRPEKANGRSSLRKTVWIAPGLISGMQGNPR